ncbi:MAG TPA: MBL fold metallo-hydrolase [Terriglobales bacterium]|nr:MBL fold metallo-hydrolase [Terriglobales bacterium]
MFELTFLGHQGWQVTAGTTNVLLDPLLDSRFGHDPGGNGFDVFPPRQIDFDKCPPIDAVVISHEHEDHFNVATIERLDRDIPIYFSARSSTAVCRFIRELGFDLRLATPGEVIEIGGLIVTPMAQATLSGSHPGEWDSLALHLADRGGDGSFFTTVDHRPQARTFAQLHQRQLRPALLSYADNEQDHSAMFPWAAPRQDGASSLAEELRYLFNRAMPRDYRPQGVLLCANGYSTRGELAWMNGSIFHRDPAGAFAQVRPELGDLFFAPKPGDVVRLQKGRRSGPAGKSEWLRSLPPTEWPAHGAGARPIDPFGPATGEYRLTVEARAALADALGEFARYLYGSTLFQEMYLLDADALGGRRGAIAIVAIEGDDAATAHDRGGEVWVWDPTGCCFVAEARSGQEQDLVAGVRCWAADLLAVLTARMPAASMTVGRMSGWNWAPAQLRFELPNLIHMYCHPLRMPDAFLELYRRLRSGASPRLRARSYT